MSISKNDCRLSRKARIRRKINGTADCPRLVVFRSNEHIYAQIINDETGTTLVSASTLTLSKNGDALHSNIAGATGVGMRSPASPRKRISTAWSLTGTAIFIMAVSRR